MKAKKFPMNLYHTTLLNIVQKKLDEAVFAVYGGESDLSDEEILEKLLPLNLERGK